MSTKEINLRFKLLILPMILALLVFNNHPTMAQTKKSVPLIGYLWSMSYELDFYFTLSKDSRNAKNGVLATTMLTDLPKVETTQDIVTFLQQNQGLTVVIDKTMPKVIHIADHSLYNDASYPLSGETSLIFSGNLQDLVKRLGSNPATRIGSQKRFAYSGDKIFGDFTTHVSFDSSKLPLISILSNYIPLSNYSRLIWESQTVSRLNGTETSVIHQGPVFVPNDKQTTREILFNRGQEAFLFNKNSASNADSALSFIQAQMKEKEPRQVRWAMFYLGKWKVEKAIPTLLEFVAYQYTPSPLVEERYPALRALTDIGEPAAKAALAAMTGESNAIRLERLSRVVLRVSGADIGRQRVEMAAKSVRDQEQRNAVLTALTKALQPGATATIEDFAPKP